MTTTPTPAPTITKWAYKTGKPLTVEISDDLYGYMGRYRFNAAPLNKPAWMRERTGGRLDPVTDELAEALTEIVKLDCVLTAVYSEIWARFVADRPPANTMDDYAAN